MATILEYEHYEKGRTVRRSERVMSKIKKGICVEKKATHSNPWILSSRDPSVRSVLFVERHLFPYDFTPG